MSNDAKPLLVFFSSERSGPARRMESLLAHLARKERTRLRVMRVDVHEQPDLAERFNVGAVPRLVLVKGKRVVDRIDGRASDSEDRGHDRLASRRSGRLRKTAPLSAS